MEENKGFSLINFGGSKLLNKIYDDLLQPGVQEVGKSIGTALALSRVAVLPAWFIAESGEVLKKNMQKYLERMSEIPKEQVCEVPPEIGVPIIEKLSYTTNEYIRDAYVNLLTKASSYETADLAHPSFIAIIERLSADEAKIIEYLNNVYFIPYINYKAHKKGGGNFVVKRWLTGLETKVNLDFKSNTLLYLTNLENLGIIIPSPEGIYKMNSSEYEELRLLYPNYTNINDGIILKDILLSSIEGMLEFKNIEIQLVEEVLTEQGVIHPDIIATFDLQSVSMQKGYFDITTLGRKFIKACTSTSNKN